MEEVRGDSVRVRIVQTSACAACKVAGHCSAFLILVAVLVIALWAIGDEGVAAIIALASLVPYYLLLHGMERRLARKFSFVINQ